MKLSTEELNLLQRNTQNIRNVCILAHVDHGKTSLSDNLLASNGIISQRMAGKLRYLDSREDEQLRGITMEASTISLFFRVIRKKVDSEEVEERKHLINLIDSPGHIDFSSEVSTASRLCDGAVVLVDAVEGVCSQTVNVLRQCWVDKLKPLLVINKVDRLITELQLTPLEASLHMTRLIEQVNSVIGSFFAGERMEDDMIWRESGEQNEFVEKDDEHIYFAPERNNVIFASAIDGWAFSINTFARLYQAKLGFSQSVLTKTLWGDFYLDMKNRKILPGKKVKQLNYKTLFVSLILEPIWAVYQNCVMDRDEEKLEKIITKLGVKVSDRDLRSKDPRNLLSLVMSQWLPLSHALLGAVVDYLPSPEEAQQERMGLLLNECLYDVVPSEPHERLLEPEFEKSILNCGSENNNYTLAYISKLLSIPNDHLPKDPSKVNLPELLTPEQLQEKSRKTRELAKIASEQAAVEADRRHEEYNASQGNAFDWNINSEDLQSSAELSEANETIMAFSRIYSGSLTVGQKIVVVGPKYDPLSAENVPKEVEIKDLFLFMGKEFVRMDTVPSGNIVGIVGMENYVLKNATLMSNSSFPFINLASTKTLIHNKPIMKIAVEPTKLRMLEKLEKGLDLLAKADPVLEWYIDDDTGEIIMCVAGELHLERCLKDLEDRFAKGVEVEVMEPVIPFREGLTKGTDSRAVVNHDDEAEDDGLQMEIEAFQLPQEFVQFLTKHEIAILENIVAKHGDKLAFRDICLRFIEEHSLEFPMFPTASDFLDSIIAFGPKRIGPNIFAELPSVHKFGHVFKDDESTFEYAHNILNAFQIATNEGPLASEPMQGVLFLLKRCGATEIGDGVDDEEEEEEEEEEEGGDDDDDDIGLEELAKLNEGRIILSAKELMHKAFLTRAPRFYLAMYTCDIQASAEVLGKVYAVVQQRGGSIISEEMKEGTPFFTISARIPVVEAFGFSEDIRKKTSGAASPQLVFDGFDMLDIDPFWVPHTEEELEELGEFAERENVARRYMNNIRRRKGLFVDEKVVQNAEKQRTLKKD
ncbi:Cytoplasmic GTPase/eEF2-like protein (ribosomal biogenesis) [Scheffersomyces spartinae]|uniref:Ribosome assembly protein 1 n=1 Tax=Scheffersomyces spartinae TaxID=45513 RepID=A0A9P7VAX5_9ASCO|nr:Cytoplasmic GTPase/eEF2-like protein (ribosomal biogenesis) [Scheffersomyces spartinae]KAG7194696.1 Cytoplasmic GTPase/eEF2-like protein (ribosomal biogenesis) [Scheffersomyces spartinae]